MAGTGLERLTVLLTNWSSSYVTPRSHPFTDRSCAVITLGSSVRARAG
jgi:hypothetical protein